MATNERVEALERRLTDLSNENNATYNEKLEHRIISGLLQRTSTLEDRVADLSNENNATYQAHHQIARAQNVIIDVLGFTLRMLNPQHIDNRTLEDLRERLDGARLPQPHTNSAETGMELADDYTEGKRIVAERERSPITAGNIRKWLSATAEKLEAQDEPQDSTAQDNGGNTITPQEGLHTEQLQAKSKTVQGVQLGGASLSADVDAQLEALQHKLVLKLANVDADDIEHECKIVCDELRPTLEDWAQKVVELQGQLDACETANDYAIHEERQRTEKVSQLQEFHRKAEEQKAIIVRTSLMLSKENDALKAEVARLRESITSYLNVAESKAHYDSSTEWFTAIHRCEAKMKQALAEGGGE